MVFDLARKFSGPRPILEWLFGFVVSVQIKRRQMDAIESSLNTRTNSNLIRASSMPSYFGFID